MLLDIEFEFRDMQLGFSVSRSGVWARGVCDRNSEAQLSSLDGILPRARYRATVHEYELMNKLTGTWYCTCMPRMCKSETVMSIVI